MTALPSGSCGESSPHAWPRYLRSHGVADAEDVTSEVFLAVFRQVGRFSGGGAAFRALVFTVAHRRQVDWHRQRTRRGPWLPLDEAGPDPAAPSAESAALALLAEEQVVEVLDTLTPDQRSVLPRSGWWPTSASRRRRPCSARTSAR